jgi:hypothetical protein
MLNNSIMISTPLFSCACHVINRQECSKHTPILDSYLFSCSRWDTEVSMRCRFSFWKTADFSGFIESEGMFCLSRLFYTDIIHSVHMQRFFTIYFNNILQVLSRSLKYYRLITCLISQKTIYLTLMHSLFNIYFNIILQVLFRSLKYFRLINFHLILLFAFLTSTKPSKSLALPNLFWFLYNISCRLGPHITNLFLEQYLLSVSPSLKFKYSP